MKPTESDLRARIKDAMPGVIDELKEMVSIPSVAFPAFPAKPVHAMADRAVSALAAIGLPARLQEVPGGYPAVWASVPAPDGAPTVLLYGHYDVQPAPVDQGWDTDPFTATEVDGRIYGRGAADDKSGIAIHLAALSAFAGSLPVGITLVLEGEEETNSHLEALVEARPELFVADAMVIADMGNLTVGEPVLTTDLRGDVKVVVELATLADPVHSGLFGGAAPDALVALIRLLSTLTNDVGECIVPGVAGSEWDGAEYSADMLRENAGVLDGVELVGTGGVSGRLWSKPSISVLGIDCPDVATGANVLQPRARALIGMRIPPGQDAHEAGLALKAYLEGNITGGVQATVTIDKEAPAFHQDPDGPTISLMADALTSAYGTQVSTIGSGGSIPLLAALKKASPKADFLLIGAEDMALARIHGPNESVDPTEIENMALAEALFLASLAPES